MASPVATLGSGFRFHSSKNVQQTHPQGYRKNPILHFPLTFNPKNKNQPHDNIVFARTL